MPNSRELVTFNTKWVSAMKPHKFYSLNSLKEVISRIIWGSIIGLLKGDARSLDYCSHQRVQDLGSSGFTVGLGLSSFNSFEPVLATSGASLPATPQAYTRKG